MSPDHYQTKNHACRQQRARCPRPRVRIRGLREVAGCVASAEPGLPTSRAPDAASKGLMLQCTVDHRDMLEGKMAFRPFAKIAALMPRGGAQMQVAVPKRKEFGDEGDLGDAAHEAPAPVWSLARSRRRSCRLRSRPRFVVLVSPRVLSPAAPSRFVARQKKPWPVTTTGKR